MKVSECVDRLIELELGAAQLYGKIAGICKNSIVSSALSFKREEEGHVEALRKIRSSMTEEELAVTTQEVALEEFEEDVKNHNDVAFEAMEERDFFTFALQGEKNSILMYTKLREVYSEHTSVTELFSKLIAEEKKHMYYLIKILHDMK